MLKILTIHTWERVAVLRNGAFVDLLGPGSHYVWTLGQTELRTFDLTEVYTEADTVDPLPDKLPGTRLVTVEAHERLLVLRHGAVTATLGAGRYRFWDAIEGVQLRRVNVREPPIALPPSDRLIGHVQGCHELTATEGFAVVLHKDGRPERRLGPGRYRVWVGGPWSLHGVPLDLELFELPAQDLVTGDQVPVRVKAAATLRVAEPLVLQTEKNARTLAYSAVHLALREVVSQRTFDKLMTDREALSGGLLRAALARLPEVGLELVEAHVKDVILSAEVKALVNQVTFARKAAEAHSIKRREEVAATRQLANTAKLLDKNPVLLRLKELEAMAEVVQRIDKLVVVGGASELAQRISLRDLEKEL